MMAMEQKPIRKLRKGELFRLSDHETAPVWVRGEYIRETKKATQAMIGFSSLGSNTPKNMKRTNENIVSSFFYYMWNRWSKTECETVFGGMAGHFWAKWCGLSSTTLSGAAERFYAELGNNARDKIVERACELYDGQRFVTERKEKDESQIEVCECCGGRDIDPEPYDDGWSTRTWCPDCEEEHYGTNLKEYKETINAWWDSLDNDTAEHLSQGAENRKAWWQSLSFDQQRYLYKKNYWDKEEEKR